jgi:membrane protease YdiL (CAAX protease family)
MSEIHASIAGMLFAYVQQDAFYLAPGLLVSWTLWRYWLKALPLKSLRRPAWAKGLLGFGLGAGLALAAVLPGLLGGSFRPSTEGYVPYDYLDEAGGTVPLMSCLFGAQSLYEELLFRQLALGGFALLLLWQAGVLHRMASGSSQPAPAGWRARAWFWCGTGANFAVALAFASVHQGNPNISPLAGAGIAAAGLMLGQLCWNGGALWGAWGAHWAWNLTLALLGLPVSGIGFASSPLGIGFAGAAPGLLSGGSFGPEASLPALIVLLAAYAWLVRGAWVAAHSIEQEGARPQ